MLEAPQEDGFDAGRARLIGSIYEVLLRPEHFDSFMADWSDFVDQAARRLGELQVSEGPSARQLEDPVIEAHFRRAFALFERMGRGESVVPAEAGSEALLVLGRGGTILSSRPEAAALFGAPVTLSGLQERLEADSVTRLAAFLSAFDRAPASGRFAVLSLAESGENSTELLPGGGLLAVVSTRSPEGDGFAAELRPLQIGWTPALSAILSNSFRLTPREADLVRELTRGGDLAALAQRGGRSLNTLRAQLKAVFAKTRTGTQSELMRLVAALMLHSPDPPSRAEAAPAAANEVLVDVGDGRQLPVLVLGPQDGVPVVFVHGMLEGLASLGGLRPALKAAGIRLYAPMRPNFGSSYPDTRIREAPDVFARDLGAALVALGLPRVVLLGHMAGTIYAYGAAARLGQAVAGIVAVSGCVPITSLAQFASMTPRHRAGAYTARFAPALMPAVLRAGIAQIDSRSAENFMTPLYPKGSHDGSVLERPGIGEAIINGYRYTVAQGTRALQIDAWHVTRDWSALVEGSDCPLCLIHGELDPVVSLESVRAFAQRRDRARLHEIAGEGQLVLYSRPGAVLAEVGAFARRCLV